MLDILLYPVTELRMVLFVRFVVLYSLVTCWCVQAFGQERSWIDVGVIAGAPVQRVLRYEYNQYERLFSIVDTHDDDSFPIVIGPAVAVNVTRYIGFETGALYRPIHLTEVYIPVTPMPSGPANPRVMRGSWWEYPLLAKVRVPGQAVNGFAKVGAVPHRERVPSSPFFQITSTTGVAVGGGFEWNQWQIKISPEVRYSHWTKRYSNLGWSASPDRIDVLVGLTFH
jgi:hypothetical protein